MSVISIDYLSLDEVKSSRELYPLGLVYWGGKWTLVAYCQLRADYREFRLDRIQGATLLEVGFSLHDKKNLEHYVALIKAQYGDC